MLKFYGALLFAALAIQGLLLANSVDSYAHLGDSSKVDDFGTRLVSSQPVAHIEINMSHGTVLNLSRLVIGLAVLAGLVGLFQRDGLEGRIVRWTLGATALVLLGFALLFNGWVEPWQSPVLIGTAIFLACYIAANWLLSDANTLRAMFWRRPTHALTASAEIAAVETADPGFDAR